MIPKMIEEWEVKKSVLEKEFSEELSENLQAAILVAMLPQNFKDMIFENQGSEQIRYLVVRDKVLAVAGSRIAQAQPTPMDIGAVNDEAAVAAGTWGDASLMIEGEQDIDQIKVQGKGIQCYWCGGYGHVSRMCATPMPDKGYQKGQQRAMEILEKVMMWREKEQTLKEEAKGR